MGISMMRCGDGAHITSFTQQRPVEGAPATEQTEVLIAYDSRNLYFGIHAHYSDLRLIRANRTDRDKAVRDDIVSIFFDPFLAISAHRLRRQRVRRPVRRDDGQQSATGGGGGGGGFKWRRRRWRWWIWCGGGAAEVVAAGRPARRRRPAERRTRSIVGCALLLRWAARRRWLGGGDEHSVQEPALSKQGRDEVHRWGFQIQRDIESKNESVVWAVSRDIMGFIRQMGVLQGMTDLSTSRNFEIMPTFTAIKSGTLDTSSGTFRNADVSPEAGVNVKYGITSNLTADFTLNPDFSQIESDRPQIDVNQRFPLFYPNCGRSSSKDRKSSTVRGRSPSFHTRTIVDPSSAPSSPGKWARRCSAYW